MSTEEQMRREFEEWHGITITDPAKAPKTVALLRQYKNAWEAAWHRAYQLGLSKGREQMKEEAARIADAEGAVSREEGGNLARWDACNNVAAAIRSIDKKD